MVENPQGGIHQHILSQEDDSVIQTNRPIQTIKYHTWRSLENLHRQDKREKSNDEHAYRKVKACSALRSEIASETSEKDKWVPLNPEKLLIKH